MRDNPSMVKVNWTCDNIMMISEISDLYDTRHLSYNVNVGPSDCELRRFNEDLIPN